MRFTDALCTSSRGKLQAFKMRHDQMSQRLAAGQPGVLTWAGKLIGAWARRLKG
jgi:hypothetical protein